MAIWKCAYGGYHSGLSCQEKNYSEWLNEESRPESTVSVRVDVQMVRIPDRNELLAVLSDRYSQQFFDEDIDAILETLAVLTPEGTSHVEWKILHNR